MSRQLSFKVVAALALLVGAFVVFYMLSAQGALVQWGGLLVLLAAAVVLRQLQQRLPVNSYEFCSISRAASSIQRNT